MPAVLLVLPRADHWLAYEPLIEAINADQALQAVVAGAPPPATQPRARCVTMHLYLPKGAGRLGWLSFIIRRELAARRAIRRLAPALVVVPSDVADATLAFVEAARARSIPVVYVQGTQVFPNYVAVNAATEAAASSNRRVAERAALRQLQSILPAFGIHAKLHSEVLGSRSDAIVVAGDAQRQVLLAEGVDPRRIHVLGAPFVDRLVRLGRADRSRAADSDGNNLPTTAAVLTKDLVRLGLTDEAGQRRIVERILKGIASGLPRWQTILKLHPMEHFQDYIWVRDQWPSVRIVTEGSAEELLSSCGLAISIGTSSPALAARFLGVPVVVVTGDTLTLVDAHLKLFTSDEIARADADLPAVLRRAVEAAHRHDQHNPDELADGQASSRIIALFHRLLQHRSGAATTTASS